MTRSRTGICVLLISIAAGMTGVAQQLPAFPKRQLIPEAARGFIGTWM